MNNKSARHTEEQQKLERFFSIVGVHPDCDIKTFRREELTKDGKPKTYTPDFYFTLPFVRTKPAVILEVEGPASASKDNEERDAYFLKLGIPVVHLPNEMVRKYAAEIALLVAAFV